MATALHTFMDIFEKEIDNQSEPIQLKKIVIPIIQRDYAQGRKSAERVRDRFLDSLYSAVTEAPITLDFIYGDIDEAGIMTPLDGQQRLTTLFYVILGHVPVVQPLYFAALAMAAGVYQITGIVILQDLGSFGEDGMVFTVAVNHDERFSGTNYLIIEFHTVD